MTVNSGFLRNGIPRGTFKASEKGRKQGFNMEEHENQQGHFFMGFLIGGALGALAGIFFAPKSGRELRSDLKEKGSELLKDAKEVYADAGAKAKEIIEEARHRADELKKEADRYLSDARQKAKKILARGDQKEIEAGQTEEREAGNPSS
jgi:gas vesicle protein